MKRSDKKLISYIFINKMKEKEAGAIVNLLTDNYEFHQLIIKFNVIKFRPAIFPKLDLFFKQFRFDKNTSIGILNVFNKTDALYIWLHTIAVNNGANMKLVKPDEIARRIFSLHPSYLKGNHKQSEIGVNYYNKLWKKIVINERCPWITKEIDEQVELMSYNLKKREQTSRLGLYYLMVKKFIYSSVKKSIIKNSNKN